MIKLSYGDDNHGGSCDVDEIIIHSNNLIKSMHKDD